MSVSVVSLDEVLNGFVRRYPCVTALGTFDGVHLGHMAILHKARSMAQATGAKSIAFTFDRLPLEALRPEQAPPLITLPSVRFALIAQVVDEVVVIPFDQQLTNIQAPAFIDQVLMGGLGTVGVVAGYNYTFGAGAQGNAELLLRYASTKPLTVSIIPPVE